MWNSKMYWQNKGVVRLVFVVSVIAFFLGVFIYTQYYADRSSSNDLEVLLEAFAFSSFCFILVWVSYFAVVWIIKGFRD